jgi:transglutaminase-like putative cysteine protease
MQIRAGFNIAFETEYPAPLLLMVSLRPEREVDLATPQILVADPPVPIRQYLDSFGNVCTRALIAPGRTTFSSDFIIEDCGLLDPSAPHAPQLAVADLPDEAVVFLLGSRYCETDLLVSTAWSLFGHVEPGWGRVLAIVRYVHERITFGYPSARATRTAREAHDDQAGVCRDYAHLAVAFCRCMNIPARYCTGYLGDIGVPPMDAPMDFAGWMEAYIGGQWHTFDPRNNQRRIGRVLIAHGRDAADVAISMTFGPNVLESFKVWTDEAEATAAA